MTGHLALAFAPRDPAVALELLTLPGGPLPWHARHRLIGALKEAPGIGGPLWMAAVNAAVTEAATRDEAEAERAGTTDGAALARLRRKAEAGLRAAIDEWFGGETYSPTEGIPAARAAALCGMVARWSRRRSSGEGGESVTWREAAAIAEGLEAALAVLPPETRLSRVQLAQVHEDALESGPALAASVAEVGRAAVCRAPGAVLGGAREVVWWGFTATNEGLRPEPWLPAERLALEGVGLRLHPPGASRAAEAWAWRRPVLAGEGRLVLVRWRSAGDRPTMAHPLEDELAARLGEGWRAPVLTTAEQLCHAPEAGWAPSVGAVPVATLVPAPAIWNLPPARLGPPPTLSFSMLDKLFGCPLGHVLGEFAGLRAGVTDALPDLDRMVGNLAHTLVQELALAEDFDQIDVEEAADRAGEAFDARVASEAALLLADGQEVERRRAVPGHSRPEARG